MPLHTQTRKNTILTAPHAMSSVNALGRALATLLRVGVVANHNSALLPALECFHRYILENPTLLSAVPSIVYHNPQRGIAWFLNASNAKITQDASACTDPAAAKPPRGPRATPSMAPRRPNRSGPREGTRGHTQGSGGGCGPIARGGGGGEGPEGAAGGGVGAVYGLSRTSGLVVDSARAAVCTSHNGLLIASLNNNLHVIYATCTILMQYKLCSTYLICTPSGRYP